MVATYCTYGAAAFSCDNLRGKLVSHVSRFSLSLLSLSSGRFGGRGHGPAAGDGARGSDRAPGTDPVQPAAAATARQRGHTSARPRGALSGARRVQSSAAYLLAIRRRPLAAI